MTRERAEELADMFDDNYELAKDMGADNAKLALVAALLYTLDDIIHNEQEEPLNRLGRKMEEIKSITDKWENE